MPFLLMIFLILVCLFSDYPPGLIGGPSVSTSAWATALVVALIGLHAFYVSRRLARPLARDPGLRDQLLPRYERGRFLHQFVLFGGYTLALTCLGWGWAVQQFWQFSTFSIPPSAFGQAQQPNQPLPLPGLELLTLAPFLLGQVLSWLFFYDADLAVHQAAQHLLDHPGPRLAPGGRWSYVFFQLRQKLSLVCIPVALLITLKGVSYLIPVAWQEWVLAVNAFGFAGLLVLLIGMPWLVRLVLGLKPLPAGVLRDRLLATARRLNFRCSDILLWNTRSGMANALVVGLIPWVRYIVFTDRLVEEFPEEEVEAVFGHEIGHIKHHHMTYYLVFLMASIAVLGMIGSSKQILDLFPWLLSAQSLNGLLSSKSELAAWPLVLALVSYVFIVFGFLSRRCERQADIYGCRVVSCTSPTCRGHDEDQPLPAGAPTLCPTGIRTFIQALEKVAVLNGISRDRPGYLQSWQHSTIAKRVAFLQRVLDDPRVERAFQRRVALMKWALFVALGCALAALGTLNDWSL